MKSLTRKSLGLSVLALLLTLAVQAQNITVKGTVSDQNGDPVAGAFVTVQNTTTGTSTDIDGAYSLSVPSNGILEVSFMGYVTETVPVDGRTTVNVTLVEDSEALEATVVIGYGTARKSDITGSIASVTGDNIREVPANDITYALQGRIAGVDMFQTSSRPGESMTIRIRGQRSLSASNDPLIVLDGMPFMGTLSDISTSDIKSMDILKDAASTAIYGSRGANGVIMITTYKGVKGQDPKISFNSYVSFKDPIKYPLMNASELVALREISNKYPNIYYGDEQQGVNTDWQDLFYRTGITQNYEMSVNGGTQKGSYSFGVNYMDDEAVVPTQGFQRIGARAAIDQNFGKYVRVGFNSNSSYNTRDGIQVSLTSILPMSPLISPYNESGELRRTGQMPQDTYYIWSRERLEDLYASGQYIGEEKSFASYNAAYLEVQIPGIEGLLYKLSGGFNFRQSNAGTFTGTGVGSDNVASPNNAVTRENRSTRWTVENLLTYDRTFSEKHRLNIVGLYSAEQDVNIGQVLSANNVPNEKFLYYNIGASNINDITIPTGTYTKTGLLSYMGRIMYSYDDKYMFSAAVRSDASSRLAEGHQWHTYPAVSIGWNIHKENFMYGTRHWLDELKLRVGYGETSNQAIAPYATLGRLNSVNYNFGDSDYQTGYYVSTLPNPELGWEFSRTWNYGLDYSFFKGRLRGTLEYYSVNTSNVLLSISLPSTAGVGSYTANIGSTANKGLELSVNGTILDNLNGWTWTAGLNIYANKNTLTSLASGQTQDTGNGWFVGYPINCIYDYEYLGIWQQDEADVVGNYERGGAPGMIKVRYTGDYNADGTPTRVINSSDRVPISADSKLQGGFNTAVSWKNWDLSVIGAFKVGGILNSTLHGKGAYLNMLSGRRNNIKVDYWTPQNTSAHYPMPGGLTDGDFPKYVSTLAYFDASYAKIRTITLGYTLSRMNWVKRIGVDRLRVYATVQNPGIVLFSGFHKETGLDPETNSLSSDARNYASSAGWSLRSSAASGQTGGGAVVGFNTPSSHNYLIGVNLTF